MTTLDFQALFAHAADGMLVLDASLVVVEANEAFAALLGTTRDALVGRLAADFTEPQDPPFHSSPAEIAAWEGSASMVRRFRRADGSTLEGEVTVSRLPEDAICWVVRDVRRPGVVSALRASEALFRDVAESLNAGLVVTDLANRALYVNERMCEITGFPREELEGHELGPILFVPAEQDAHDERLRRRLAGMREQYEVRHRRRDGSSFLAGVSASPLHDGAGRVVGTVGVVIDVTDRYEWEREMAVREHRYRLMFEMTPLPAWVYDTSTYRFLAVNPAAIESYGYSEAQFLAMTILDIRPPEEVERVKRQVQARQNGLPVNGRDAGFRHRKADGTDIDVEINSHAFDFEGHSARIVLVNDVTEARRLRRRELEIGQQLLQAQKMEAVGRLAGGVAHDFNNLLSVVMSAAEVLSDELPAHSPLREDVRDIRQAAERGAALTRQLLALGRKEVHAPRPLDVHEVVMNVQRLLARALGGGVRLEIRREAAEARAIADASQLEQVLVNLAINARDAMPGGGLLVISIGVRTLDPSAGEALELAAGDYVAIEVSDTGVGMDETTLSRAFEPFYTTKGPLEGTGLGLSTVYGIVRQSGGAVTLASRPAEGTRVTVYLPKGTGASEMPVTTGGERAIGTASPKLTGRVLLVEDEPQIRVQARRLLERCGFTVLEAVDGADGARVFGVERTRIDVVVTDVVMPVLGGVELVSRVRAMAPKMPVVFVSGFAAEDRDLPLGARTAFVAKPYTMASLRAAIEGVIAG